VCLKPNKQTVTIHGTDQLLNFLVNGLRRRRSFASLANNAEITGEGYLWNRSSSAIAPTGPLSLRGLCVEPELTRWEHGPTAIFGRSSSRTARTSRQHAPAKGSDELRTGGGLRTTTCGRTGDEDDTDGAITRSNKRGTTAFHAFATLYAVSSEQTLVAGGTPSQRRRYRTRHTVR